MTHNYAAAVSRDGRFWLIAVTRDGVTFGLTQARKLGEVEPMARDLIATILDEPADAVPLTITFASEIAELTTPVFAARANAETAKGRAEDATRAAARQLLDKGVSVRDAATLLGVSASWVSVLTRHAA